MNRWRLDIAYDGTDFSGWAYQPGRRTVQGVLQDALSTVLRGPVRLTVAGRTDAGVHAQGQVAHFDHPADIEPGPMIHRLAKFLPKDVRVREITLVPPDFDARFAALRRHYRYRLSTAPYGVDPLERRTVVPCRVRDVAAMQQASQTLLGLHDFAAFCRPRPGATTIRDLQRFDWQSHGYHLEAHVTADAFCWSMVRGLVGAVVAIGEERRTPQWLAGLLSERHRSPDIPVAPAHGLSLVAVDYPPESEWAARAQQTRDSRAPAVPESCCGE